MLKIATKIGKGNKGGSKMDDREKGSSARIIYHPKRIIVQGHYG